MSYIVKNCPCYTSNGGYYDCWANQDTWCENITDCKIKQVIEKCNVYKNFTAITISDYAKRESVLHILDLFDIELLED